MSFLSKKFSLLLLLLTFTGAQPSDHNVLSILKTKFDAIFNVPSVQEKSRFARANTINCGELKDGIPSVDVINQPCKSLTGDPVYTLKVENVKGSKWDEFTFKVTDLNKIILEIDGSDIPTLKLDKLDTIGGSKDITIKNNKHLKEVSFTLTENMVIGKLLITGNDELETIKISPVLTFGCTEIIISKNPKLKTLEFVGAATYTIPKMEISHNIQLAKISDNGKWKADGSLLIEDNRLLEEETLTRIKAINSNWNIQPFGQCIFNSPIQKLDELNSCVVVNQLKFAKGASGKIGDLKLNRVEDGDVVLADLPRDKAQFLDLVDGMAKISSDVCDFGNINGIEVTSPKNCPTTAAPATVASAPPPGSGPSGAPPSPSGSGPTPGPSSNSSSTSEASSTTTPSPSWFRLNNGLMWMIVAVLLVLLLILFTILCKWWFKRIEEREKLAKHGHRTPRTPRLSELKSPNRPNVAPALDRRNPTPSARPRSVTRSAENARAPTNSAPPAEPSPAVPSPLITLAAGPSPIVPLAVVLRPVVARPAADQSASAPPSLQSTHPPRMKIGNIIENSTESTLKNVKSIQVIIAGEEEM